MCLEQWLETAAHLYLNMLCMGHLVVFGVVISAYLYTMSMHFIIIKSYIGHMYKKIMQILAMVYG